MHKRILFGHKKEISPFETIIIDLDDIMLSETSQRKTNMYVFTYM